jgi:hypothetical protein
MTTPRLNASTIVSLLMLVVVPLAGGQKQKSGTVQKPESLACEVQIHDSNIRSEAENRLSISIHNLLATDVTVNSLEIILSPSYYLPSFGNGPIEDAYVGLVNLETKRAFDPTDPTTSLKISGRGAETFAVDLSSLKWGQVKSSLLPFHGLKSVPPGKYTLYVSTMRNGDATEHISNRISVELRK